MFLLLGSHLFPFDYIKAYKEKKFLLIESYELFTRYNFHKHRIMLYMESMRNYALMLKEKNIDLEYVKLSEKNKHASFESVLKNYLQKEKEIISFTIEDRFLHEQLGKIFLSHKISWKIIQSPMFLNSDEEITKALSGKKRIWMKTFYEDKRKENNILMKNGKPLGGKFSFDDENRLSLPKNINVPSLPSVKPGPLRKEVSEVVDNFFKKHPGETSNFWLATTRKEALAWMKTFFKERFNNFGPYEDALSLKYDFVFHSVLSPYLNIGLITPKEVIDGALSFYEEYEIPLNSLEGFIRQIMGWREYIKGVDFLKGEKLVNDNFFNHKRKLKDTWYTGKTKILPLDECIKKVDKYGYCHHIERLMIMSNIMLLTGIDPKECYRWFMEMFVDSADWVMGPNILAMGQFCDGGKIVTKPYICGSNYLRKMGDYPKGDWCDILDGLYWNFINEHKEFFKSQPRLNMMSAMLDKMEKTKKARLFDLALEFIHSNSFE